MTLFIFMCMEKFTRASCKYKGKFGGILRIKTKYHIEWLTTSSSGQDAASWPRQPRFDSWCGQYITSHWRA